MTGRYNYSPLSGLQLEMHPAKGMLRVTYIYGAERVNRGEIPLSWGEPLLKRVYDQVRATLDGKLYLPDLPKSSS
jgi:hypothetical protein